MARKRKFADGGETPALDRLASGEDKGSFDTDTYARAKRFLEQKDEAEKPAPKSAPKAAAKPAPRATPAAPKSEPKTKEYEPPAMTAEEKARSDKRAREQGLEGVYPETMLVGGAGAGLRALASRFMGKAAPSTSRALAPSTSRALAESETPLTFLGRSGSKNITPAERIAARKAEALEGPSSATRVAAKEGPKKLPPASERVSFRKAEREKVEAYARGGKVRGGGAEQRGKTKGRFV